MLRILHTSDWHLGHTLSDLSRVEEHGAFLGWLVDTLVSEDVDALLIAGDVFDTANPPAEAQAAFYRFIAAARQRCRELDIVVIGGNHDSAARLDAPSAILDRFGVHVVGGLPSDLAQTVVPVTDRTGAVAAWVLAVPFLRPADLPLATVEGSLALGVRAVYDDVLRVARGRRAPGQAIVAMGHAYVVGGRVSELSERKILGGHQHALPLDVFADAVTYVALGHLHLPQRIGASDRVRYAGSPLPLAIDEADYPHQVCVVEIEGEKLCSVRSVRVPRAVEVIRVPRDRARPVDEVLPALAALPSFDPEMPEWRRPYLEVSVLLPAPEPALREKVDKALEGKAARLVRLRVERTVPGHALGDVVRVPSLSDLGPPEVFRRCWASQYEGEPPEDLLCAFVELVAIAEEESG
jgi:DNA repair protein SbcD/Mre11